MASFPFDVVVFDLDGTLVDSSADLAAALNHVLARLGRPTADAATVRRLVGRGARVLIREGLALTGASSERLVDENYPVFIDYYAAHIRDGTRPYPGVEAMLDELGERGARPAICTNKPERLTHLLIDALGWRGRFEAIVGADTLPVRKPDPAVLHHACALLGVERALMIGDSANDALAARAAGIPVLLVTYGYTEGVPVDTIECDGLLSTASEALSRIQRA